MLQTIKDQIHRNGTLMLLTFELFWIVVFLLDRVGKTNANGVPQFLYVNF